MPALCDLGSGGCAANPTGLLYAQNNPYHIRQTAIFGEASYELIPHLTGTVGLRGFFFNNTVDYSTSGIFTASGNTVATSGTVQAKDSGVTPKFNIAYEPSRSLTIYGTVAEGFRPGGVNLPIPVSGASSCLPYLQQIGLNQAPLSYNPDRVWSYEVGEKARMFDGKLQVNGDMFYLKWQGVQQVVNLACGFPYTANAGNAASYGPELEIAYHINDEFTFNLSGTYTHAQLTSVDAGTGLNVGQRLLNIPRYTADASLSYRKAIDEKSSISARIANNFVGPQLDVAYTFVELPSYDIVKARIEYDRGPVSYAVFVDNLTNTHVKLSSNNTGVSFNSPDLIRYSTNQPLTAGIDIRIKY